MHDMVEVLTENIELEGGFGLSDHVFSAAYDHPAVIIRRQVVQVEVVFRFQQFNLHTQHVRIMLLAHMAKL